jgi:hypothetical protein
LEAEAVSCEVTAALGYDFARFGAAYLTSYAVTGDDLRASLPRVHSASRTILDALDAGRA